MIRVAIVHYHLRSGGVSRVIAHAVTALGAEAVRVVVLAGVPPPADLLPLERTRIVEGLDYADADNAPPTELLVDRLEAAAREALGGPPDLWHLHNHSMGKNGALTDAVTRLATRGHRLLLQIHDFAEDGRPQLFRGLLAGLGRGRLDTLGQRLYPQAPHIHYATINGRDAGLLADLGIPDERRHHLPNAATLDTRAATPWTPDPAGPRLMLYPVRAIRRKNIGELLLWAVCADADTRFAVTLAPTSPADRVAYDRWTAFARERALPVAFEVGRTDHTPFEERLAGAWAAVTTSIAEGFGLTFLEPWLLNRPVVGRRLPEITGDLEAAGLDLSGLYTQWLVPTAWLDTHLLRVRLVEGYTGMLAAFGRAPRPGECARAVAATLSNDQVDFGRLDEESQAAVIDQVRRDPGLRAALSPSRLVEPVATAATMDANRRLVAAHYNLDGYAQRLMAGYRAVAGAAVGPLEGGLDVTRLLEALLAPERFNLLRT